MRRRPPRTHGTAGWSTWNTRPGACPETSNGSNVPRRAEPDPIMKFTKMHGIGNDYVYVDTFDQEAPADPARLARAISDRHFGVGSDGLILIGPSGRADARMRMFNADGSESEMCGNGIRCVAKYVFDHGIASKSPLTIETGRGILTLEIEAKNGKAVRV